MKKDQKKVPRTVTLVDGSYMMKVMKGERPLNQQKGNMMSTKTTEEAPKAAVISPKDFAELVGSDPKTVRRFLRSLTTDRANKGGRWEISTDDVDALTARWNERAKGTTFAMRSDDAPSVDEAVAELTDSEDTDEVDLDDIDEL